MKYSGVLAAMLIGASFVYAANIRDIDVGDGMYLQGIFSDELVYVVRIDYESNRVKIRRSEDGTTKWVSPSDLISRESSIGNDVARGAVVIGALACIFDPESCKNISNESSSRKNFSQSSSSSQSTGGHEIYFKNSCSKPLDLILRYKKLNGTWTTLGWWSFDAYESAILKYGEERLRSNNSIFYYYAHIPGSSYSWSGDENRSFDGKTYPMRIMELSTDADGDWVLELPCSNLG